VNSGVDRPTPLALKVVMCANNAGSMIIGAQGRPFITICRTLAPFQSVLPSAGWNSRNCNNNNRVHIAIFCKMTSCNLKATYQRFGGAQRLCTVQHSYALRRRPHAPRNAGKSVPDYTVAVVKNTVVFHIPLPRYTYCKILHQHINCFGGNKLRNILQMARQIKWIGTNIFHH